MDKLISAECGQRQAGVLVQIPFSADAGERRLIYYRGAQSAEIALISIRMLIEQGFANNQIQQGVAKEFKTLIVISAETAMRQCLLQQLSILKPVGKCGLQCSQICTHL